MGKEKIKVYAYTRVSPSMQIDGYSLDAQKSRMKAFCEFNDYEIAGEYEDAGAVVEVLRKLVSNKKFAGMMREKINMEVDTTALDQEISAQEKTLRQSYLNKDVILSDPAGVFTSEDAKIYKPGKGLFELALSSSGLSPDEVIHIGDSVSSDVHGAAKVGIRALWLNRFGKSIPEGVESITWLSEAFDRIG